MKGFELVIVGGGLAAARAARSFREAGGDGRAALVAAESVLPYHRPPLSKRYLRGETDAEPFVEDEAFYRDHDVELLLGTTATAVDPGARELATSAGSLRFEKLLLATGAAPRRLPVPGAALDGVHTLRTLADAHGLRRAALAARRAVVVGGGFIGLEVAASLRALGLPVTLIHLGHGLFDQLGSSGLSDELAELYRGRGVELLLGRQVAAFGGAAQLAYVETADGLRVEADLAVVGVGVTPNIELLRDSGVAIDDGVVVDERFRTDAPGVFAVGDVARFYDPLYRRLRRIEHWSNADYQGREVGRILAGAAGGYDAVSSFFTELFGTTIKVFGDVGRFDAVESEGSLSSGALLVRYADGGRLVAALTVGQDETTETHLADLIRAGAPGSSDLARVSARGAAPTGLPGA